MEGSAPSEWGTGSGPARRPDAGSPSGAPSPAREWEPGKRRHPASRARIVTGLVSVAGLAGLTATLATTQSSAATTTVSSRASTAPSTTAPPGIDTTVPSSPPPTIDDPYGGLTTPTTAARTRSRSSARAARPSAQPNTSSGGS